MDGIVVALSAIVKPFSAKWNGVDGYEVVRTVEDASSRLAIGDQIVLGYCTVLV